MKNIYKYLIGLFSTIAALISVSTMFSKIVYNKSFVWEISLTLFGAIIAVFISYIYFYFSNKRHKIFISYSLKDANIANEITSYLRDNGFTVFNITDSVFAGENIHTKISNLIKAASTFLIIISKNMNESSWISKELSLALESNKTIIPIKIDNMELPKEIGMIKYVDLVENKEESLKYLIKSIKSLN